MSVCGNFVIVGRATGYLEKWNIQSASLKFNFTYNTNPKAHDAAITAVIIDNTNEVVVSGCFDGKLRVRCAFDLPLVVAIEDWQVGT